MPNDEKKYWENRYQTNDVPWNVGGITTPLAQYICQIKDKNIKILLPGAGMAYELDFLWQLGFRNVFVLDFAPSTHLAILQRLPHFPKQQLIAEDFFNYQNKFDLIIEQTFFCAIPVSKRYYYVQKMHDLLCKNGKLVGLLFQFNQKESQPPYGGHIDEYTMLFQHYFRCNTLEKCYNSIKPRQERELFFIFEKK